MGSHEERVGSGLWFNNAEIRRALEVLEQLLGKEKSCEGEALTAAQVTVLMPYLAQQMKIRERVSAWRNAPEVNSVNVFQGRENDIIVVSTVCCGTHLASVTTNGI